jgi:hypothetical protein
MKIKIKKVQIAIPFISSNQQTIFVLMEHQFLVDRMPAILKVFKYLMQEQPLYSHPN